MSKMKGQDKISELSEVELGNLLHRGYKIMIVKVFQALWGRLDEQGEKLGFFNKGLKNIKKNKTEMKNTITEMKNTLEGINSKLDNTEEWISKLENRVVEITEAEQDKEEMRIV